MRGADSGVDPEFVQRIDWLPGDDIEAHLRLLRGLAPGRAQVDRLSFPPELEGIDLDILSQVMIGY